VEKGADQAEKKVEASREGQAAAEDEAAGAKKEAVTRERAKSAFRRASRRCGLFVDVSSGRGMGCPMGRDLGLLGRS
jgi:hypothetical protein